MENTLQIPGYSLIDEIARTGNRILYKAKSLTDGVPVLLKVIENNGQDAVELAKLKREYHISSSVGIHAVPRAVNVIEMEGGAALVMEDFGSCTLKDISAKYPLSTHQFLEIAIELTKAIQSLQKAGIVHTALKPTNILINTATHEVKVTELGSASLLADETSHIKSFNLTDDVYNYMAPEQSGRMNHTVDSRANLYSLGAIFYEMLTGSLLFKVNDIVELVYAHLAVEPIAPKNINKQIPDTLNELILNLLKKNPEERYQTAEGLLADLSECFTQLKSTGHIVPFVTGRHDLASRLAIPQKLYGREKEVSLILRSFESVCTGKLEVVLVAGYSGIGKSALVHEVQKPILKYRGLFVSGKFDQYKRNIPYSGMIDAFKQLVRQILSEPESVVSYWRKLLLNNLQGEGQLIIEVIPELEMLIGKQPNVQELPIAEAQNRHMHVMRKFVRAFANAEHPLTIFIDDLQWADISTIQFFKLLTLDEESKYIFLIGAYRDNEVDESHPLSTATDEAISKGVQVETIHVQPLQHSSVVQLISDTLKQSNDFVTPLAKLVAQRTGGNPFFVKAFLHQLADDALLTFQPHLSAWKWDINQINQVPVTENVVDLLTKKIQKIPAASQDILKIASCLGNTFDLHTLSDILEIAPIQTARQLWDSLQQGFVLPLDDSYKTAETLDVVINTQNTRYRFSHDRVQQAAYTMLSEDKKGVMHLKIVRRMLTVFTKDELEDNLFDVVSQFNRGAKLITDVAEREKLVELNLWAAQKAKDSVAFPTALNLLSTAIDNFSDTAWETNYTRTIHAYLNLAECNYLCGKYDAAEILYGTIAAKSTDLATTARLFDIQLRHYTQQGRNKEVLELGTKALSKYGISYHPAPSLLYVLPRLLWAKLQIAGKNTDHFYQLSKNTTPEKIYAIEALSTMNSSAYTTSANAMVLLAVRMLQISARFGNSKDSPYGYALIAFIEGAALFNFKQAQNFSELSLKLAREYADPIDIGKCLFAHGFVNSQWYQDVREGTKFLNEAYNYLSAAGSYVYSCYAISIIPSKEFFYGEHLDKCYEHVIRYSDFNAKEGEGYTVNLFTVERRYIAALTGKYHPHYEKHDRGLVNADFEKKMNDERLLMSLSWHYVYQLIEHFTFNNYDEAWHYTKLATIVEDASPASQPQIEFHFYRVLTIAMRWKKAAWAEKLSFWANAKASFIKLKLWTGSYSPNFLCRYLLAKAAMAAAQSKTNANELFCNAVECAIQDKFINITALGYELWALHLLTQHNEKLAKEKMVLAESNYRTWGATIKANKIKNDYPSFFTELSKSDDKGLSNDSLSGMLDLEAVLRSSLAISGEISLSGVMKKVLRIMMENVGAQTGYLILNRDSVLTIEAAVEPGQKEAIVLQSEDVEHSKKVAASVVNFVLHSGENVLLSNALTEGQFTNDRHIQQKNVLSLLCSPVKSKGKIVAIAYFENNLATGVFTPQRLNLVNLLTAQAAISIENALLYDNMEQLVRARTQELEQEKKKSDDLLLNILPHDIATELKQKGYVEARQVELATVMFCDFKDFTLLSEHLPPAQLVKAIDFYFQYFDRTMERYGIEKIKTIGDAYMAAGGLNNIRNGSAVDVVAAAIEMRNFAQAANHEREEKGLPHFDFRIGIHSGVVVAGVVGMSKFAYDIWGDTVNTAARMEQNGEAGKINISQTTYDLVKHNFTCVYRGEIEAKNKGKLKMYFVK